MTANDPEYQRAYKQRHYAANKQRYVAQAMARTKRLMAEVRDLKRQPCADCGVEYDPWVMQFDHRPDEVKVGEVSKLVRRGSRKALMDEIAKCDVVCANCHAERTYQRRGLGVIG